MYCGHYKLLIVFVTLTSFLSACNQGNQLKAVEDFSLISENIKTSSATIVNDIDRSCIRREEIENQKLSMIGKPVKNGRELVFPLVNIRNECEKWIPVVAEIQPLNNTLIIYIQSLGKLTNGNTINFTKNVQNLGSSFTNLAQALTTAGTTINISEEQQQSGIKIFDSLLNLWSSQFRYEKIKPAIICTDPAFANYTSLLEEIIQTVYLENRLKQEEASLVSKYNLAYKIAVKSLASDPAVISSKIIDLQNDYRKELEDFDKRKQAATAYMQILSETQKLHHALANNFRDKATDTEVDGLCSGYFLNKPNRPTAAVFQTENIVNPSPKELKRATKLIVDYQRKVRPLISKINLK